MMTNIKIIENELDSTFNIVNIRGLNYVNVHGDFDKPQNIQKVVEMIDLPIYCIHSGHLHHNSIGSFQKYKTIMSGSLMGMDDYCIQRRIFGTPQQIVCVCNSSGILCTYDIELK